MNAHFEDVLARDGRLVYTTMGVSMLPMLREKRDLVVVERPSGRLNKYDVALYRAEGGKCILHRVIRVEPDGYVLRGDHNRASERGVREAQIIGVLTAFVRDGREIAVTDGHYRLYVRLWCALYLPRMALRAPRALARQISRRWRGEANGRRGEPGDI